MGSISEKTVIEKCLQMLDIADYRHPYSDHGAKKLLTGQAILLLVEAQLHQHHSLWEISENLRARKEMQELTGLEEIHASTIHRKLESLPLQMLQQLCQTILERVNDCHRDKKGFPNLGKLHAVDATKIVLPKKAGEWAFCSKSENSIKIHMRYVIADETTAYPDQFMLSTGAVSDHEGGIALVTDPHATHILDRGYLGYKQFQSWNELGIPFVARVKANSNLLTIEERDIPDDTCLLRDADVQLQASKTSEPFVLRLVEFQDDEDHIYRLLTNRWDITAEEVSEIYRYRWKIELFFKWIKQHLRVVKLYNHKPEAVWSQIYIAMIAYGLCELIRMETGTKRTIWEVLKLLRIYWHDRWEQFIASLCRSPSRTSRGRKKKAKLGRPRKHPKKLKAVQFVLK